MHASLFSVMSLKDLVWRNFTERAFNLGLIDSLINALARRISQERREISVGRLGLYLEHMQGQHIRKRSIKKPVLIR